MSGIFLDAAAVRALHCSLLAFNRAFVFVCSNSWRSFDNQPNRPLTSGGGRRELSMLHSDASAVEGVVSSTRSSIRHSYLYFRTIAPDALVNVTQSERSFV